MANYVVLGELSSRCDLDHAREGFHHLLLLDKHAFCPLQRGTHQVEGVD